MALLHTNRLARSYTTFKLYYLSGVCSSHPFIHSLSCCNQPPSTRAAVLILSPTYLTLSTAHESSTDEAHYAQRQQLCGNLQHPQERSNKPEVHNKTDLTGQEQLHINVQAQHPQVRTPTCHTLRPHTLTRRLWIAGNRSHDGARSCFPSLVRCTSQPTSKRRQKTPSAPHNAQTRRNAIPNKLEMSNTPQPQHCPLERRITTASMDSQQQINALSKNNKSLKTKHIYTKTNSGGIRNSQNKGSRHRENPNSHPMPTPKKIPNRKYRTLPAKIHKTIRMKQTISPTHHCSLPHLFSPSPSLTLYKLVYSALGRLPLSPHSSSARLQRLPGFLIRRNSVAVEAPLPNNMSTVNLNTAASRRDPPTPYINRSDTQLASRTSSGRQTNAGHNTRYVWLTPCTAIADTQCPGVNSHINQIPTAYINRFDKLLKSRTSSGRQTNAGYNTRYLRLTPCTAIADTQCPRVHSRISLIPPAYINGFDKQLEPRPTSERQTNAGYNNRYLRFTSCTAIADTQSPRVNNRRRRPSAITTGHPGRITHRSEPLSTTGEPSQLRTYGTLTSSNGHIPNRQLIPDSTEDPLPHSVTSSRHPAFGIPVAPVCRPRLQLPVSPKLVQQVLSTKYPSKSILNYNLFKLILLFKWHTKSSTLSNKSIPPHAWETYAPRRAHVLTTKDLAPHPQKLRKTICIIHFLNSYTTLYIKSLVYSILAYSNFIFLQLLSKTMTGSTKPTTRHHNSNQSNEIIMEDVTPPNKRTSPHSTKSSHKKTKSNSSIISLYRDPSQMEFWYGYPIMETIAYEAGIPPIPISTPLEELIATGYVASEAAELCSACISFPRV